MPYKKYIKRGGKIYGPYIYHSKKVNGKVITEYRGKHVEEKKGKKPLVNSLFNKKVFSFLAIIVLGLLFITLFSFSYNGLTGRATFEVTPSYVIGEQINGTLNIVLKQGEFLPINSKIIVDNSGKVTEFFLNELISEQTSQGNFFVEDLQLSGSGDGYGIIGSKEIIKDVGFVFKIIKDKDDKGKEDKKDDKDKKEKNKTNEEIVEEEPVEVVEEEIIEEEIIEEPTDSDEELIEQELIEQEEESEEPTTSIITGAAISELKEEVTGSVAKGEDYTYNLEEGQSIEIISSEEEIDWSIDNNILTITTTYVETEQGFGEEYLQDETFEIEIDLSKLNLIAEEGNLDISLIYEDIEIISVSEKISVEGKTPEIIPNESLIDDVIANVTIPNTTIANITTINTTNANITITTTQYGAVVGKPVKWKKRIESTESTNVTIELPLNASNIVVFKIKDKKSGERIEICSSDDCDIEDVIEEIKQEDDESESDEELTEESDEELTEQPKTSLITGNIALNLELKEQEEESAIIKFFKRVFGGFTGRAVTTDEIGNVTEVIIDENASVYEIEYETPAPTAIETNIINGKQIIVSGPDDLHYENVLAFTQLPKEVLVKDANKIKLYWYVQEVVEKVPKAEDTEEKIVNGSVNAEENESINGRVINNESNNTENNIDNPSIDVEALTKQLVDFTIIDENNDSIIDYIEWIVPHLSNQTYEIILITKAEHLDSNRTFIEDVYDYVKARDDNWILIPSGDYIRVTFEQMLDSSKDITLFARRGNNSVINDVVVPQDIYEKKMRIDEIRGLLDG